MFRAGQPAPVCVATTVSEGFEGARRSIRNPRAVAITLSERRGRCSVFLAKLKLSPTLPESHFGEIGKPSLVLPAAPRSSWLTQLLIHKVLYEYRIRGVWRQARTVQSTLPLPLSTPLSFYPPSPVFPKQEAVAKAGKAAAPSSKKPEPAVPSAGVAAAGTTAAAATASPAVGGAAAAAVAMAKAVVAAATGAAETAPGAKAAATASKPPSVIAPPPSVQAPSSIAVLKPAGSGKSSAPEAPKALVSAAGKGAGAGAGAVAGAVNSYEMSDHDGDSSDSDSDEEESSERRRRMGKKVCLCRVMGWSLKRCSCFFFVVPGSLDLALRDAGAVVYYIRIRVWKAFVCFRWLSFCLFSGLFWGAADSLGSWALHMYRTVFGMDYEY